MAAQAKDEGRFLGGRPPYGYLIADAGPHPNPAKAADGKRLHKLDLDPEAAPVVQRIFAEFIAGHGFYAIAEGLTRDGIPSPSAHDPARNRHRCGIAWNKFAVRAILVNPRYTGHQVWNKQRKDEVLIDVEDVALGHTTKLRWNDSGKWIWSEKIVHPPIIDRDDLRPGAGHDQPGAPARPPSTSRTAPSTRTRCAAASGAESASGGCRATGPTTAPYYRCRFPAEYALANHVEHPLNVNLREDAVIGQVDGWLAREFAPHRLAETIRDLAAAQQRRARRPTRATTRKPRARSPSATQASPVPRRPRRGGQPGHGRRVDRRDRSREGRIPSTRNAPGQQPRRRRMSEAEIKAIVDRLADIVRVLHDADPDDKAEIFRQLGLRLTYHPGRGLVEAEVNPAAVWVFRRCPRGDLNPHNRYRALAPQASASAIPPPGRACRSQSAG